MVACTYLPRDERAGDAGLAADVPGMIWWVWCDFYQLIVIRLDSLIELYQWRGPHAIYKAVTYVHAHTHLVSVKGKPSTCTVAWAVPPVTLTLGIYSACLIVCLLMGGMDLVGGLGADTTLLTHCEGDR